MKKYKKISYLFLLIIIIGLGFMIYKVTAKDDSSNVKDKSLSEVKYIEQKLVSLFNLMNNISYENYTIESKTVSKDQPSENSTSESSKSSSSGENSSDSSAQQKNDTEENKEYELTKSGILNGKQETDWKSIKQEVENIYTSLSNMTLDLYQVGINQEKILKFNAEYDSLTKAVKDEDKEKSLSELSILYEYIPNFIENCTDDNTKKVVLKTKNNVLKAYSILNSSNWNEISKSISDAVQEFSQLLTNISVKENQKSTINKCYVMLNELQTSIKLKDKEIFLIKYKNLLEELEKI